ncbi:hypothetical protein IQ270_06525 [Microcoleus sp. LEGE 07076]|uniref:hypothetical protein n=1 Tax=Microcoleus sp. LEGE 07076 TaxID=915322 RepID=UPI001881CB2F|nr:hypothetical protein [Microcoleus sp. LEGE 07076]MBE9184383.1 hypothetical protein [Microcoleus sp. LEGE 07076]
MAYSNWEILNSCLYSATPDLSSQISNRRERREIRERGEKFDRADCTGFHITTRPLFPLPSSLCAKSALCGKKKALLILAYESIFRLMLQSSPYLAYSNWEILNSCLYSATPDLSSQISNRRERREIRERGEKFDRADCTGFHITTRPLFPLLSAVSAPRAVKKKVLLILAYESIFRLMLQSSPYLAYSNWEILNSYLYSATPADVAV